VWDRLEEFLHQPLAPEGQLLRMATRAEAGLTRESNEKLRLAVLTYDPGKPVFEDTAVEVFVDGPSCDLRSQGSVLALVLFIIGDEEVFEVLLEEPVEG